MITVISYIRIGNAHCNPTDGTIMEMLFAIVEYTDEYYINHKQTTHQH